MIALNNYEYHWNTSYETKLEYTTMMMDNNLPFVTVIMPIRNEAKFIKTNLDAVLGQDYPSDRYEVIVVDGMSTDGTREIVNQIQVGANNLRMIDNPQKIVPTGLNLAIRQARGEIVVRVDGHTLLAFDYLRQCVTALKSIGADNVGGKMTAVGNNVFTRSIAIATSSPFGVGGARFHYSNKDEWVDTVYLGAWPIEVFEKIGLFDEELVRNQDDEFNYRLRKNGGRIYLCQKINSQYSVRSTPTALGRQYYQYGYWKVRVLQKHPRQMSLRQFVPPVFVLSLLVSLLLTLFFRQGWLLFALIGCLYLLANIVASIYEASRSRWKYLPFLPINYAILHISYGLGFLIGMIRFANRWNK